MYLHFLFTCFILYYRNYKLIQATVSEENIQCNIKLLSIIINSLLFIIK